MEVESLRAWQREFKVFKGLKISGVSGFLFWAIELDKRKNGNNGKFRKSPSRSKQMSGVMSSLTATDLASEKNSRSLMWTNVFLGGNNEGNME